MFVKKVLVIMVSALFLSALTVVAEAPAKHPKTGAPLVCDCIKGTPKIDGNLSDWNLKSMTPAVLDAKEQIFTGVASWTGIPDNSGNFYLMWDDKNIYVGAVIKDDKIVVNKDAGNIWNADAVEVFFTLPKAAATHVGTEHYQYGLTSKNVKWNWCNMENTGNKEPDYVQVASTTAADGYTIEAAIAYSNMKLLSFKAGEVLGFHPVLDDTDATDREIQMSWTGREAHDQTLGYGQFTLSASITTTAVNSSGKATLTWGEIKAK